jgi:hypothetical protein
MPYIIQARRRELDAAIEALVVALRGIPDLPAAVGDLNYAITRILAAALELDKHPSYVNLNAAVGVLECAKLELYRRLAAPYEDSKIKSNGDLPGYEQVLQENP